MTVFQLHRKAPDKHARRGKFYQTVYPERSQANAVSDDACADGNSALDGHPGDGEPFETECPRDKLRPPAIRQSRCRCFGATLRHLLPILDIYRRYYGAKMSLFILATFYFSMSLAALAIEFAFQALGGIPAQKATVVEASLRLNYTTVLNVMFLALAALLIWRFLTTGGPGMLRHMSSAAREKVPRSVSQKPVGSDKYTCPMHPNVILENPGNCPNCDMKLIKRA
jgi:hypothetical protein